MVSSHCRKAHSSNSFGHTTWAHHLGTPSSMQKMWLVVQVRFGPSRSLYLEGCSCIVAITSENLNVTYSTHSDTHLSFWTAPPLGRRGSPFKIIFTTWTPKKQLWNCKLHGNPEWYTACNTDWISLAVNRRWLKISCDDIRYCSPSNGISDMQAADINVSGYFSSNFTLLTEFRSPT